MLYKKLIEIILQHTFFTTLSITMVASPISVRNWSVSQPAAIEVPCYDLQLLLLKHISAECIKYLITIQYQSEDRQCLHQYFPVNHWVLQFQAHDDNCRVKIYYSFEETFYKFIYGEDESPHLSQKSSRYKTWLITH